MLAELRGKINNLNSNLTDRSEDELTGNFFGHLRYLPFNRGLKHILKNAVYPANLSGIFDTLNVEEWQDNILFWPREKEAEPDVLLSFDDMVMVVEVKYLSGLSSDDDVDNSIDGQDWKESSNQLAREGKMLERIASDKTKVLIFLAPEAYAHQVYADVTSRNLLNDVLFGYMSWQKAFDAIKEIAAENPYERLVLDDLTELLYQKGFESFKNFMLESVTIDAKNIWSFDYAPENNFSFLIAQKIERGSYYEFG